MMPNLKDIWKLREQAKDLENKLKEVEVVETDLDDQLKMTVNGNQEIISVDIAPNLLAPENKEKLENSFINTFNKAKQNAQKQAAHKMQSEGGLPNLPDMG